MHSVFNLIYHSHLATLLDTPSYEIFNQSFTLDEIQEIPTVESEARGFNEEYARAFAKWTWDEDGDAFYKVVEHQPKAKQFLAEVEGRNPAYAPRIQRQFNDVVDELVKTPRSRRATILILESGDQFIRKAKRLEPNVVQTEYPCTIALTFYIRRGRLDLHVAMRSSNACTTICYDVYNFVYIQHNLARIIGRPVGYLHWNAANSHIPGYEVDLAEAIVKEWDEDGETGRRL